MAYIVRLNICAILYALILVIQTELMGNIYRICRITNLPIDTIRIVVDVTVLIIFIISTIAFCLISSKYFYKGKARYFLTILWIPYFLTLIFLASFLTPMAEIDEPSPGLGLVLFGIYLVYPFYIALINYFSTRISESINVSTQK